MDSIAEIYHGGVDDAALVAGAIGGDQEAFGSIYDRYGPRIHDFLCSLLRDRDEAADVLHDTFLVAGARLHQLRDPSRLRPWLYAIARHEGLRRIKARNRLAPLGDTEVIASGPGPAEVAAQGELAELVAAAAEGLSPRDRAVLDLHLRQGLDGEELGAAMGVTAAHAYVLLSRLRDQVERSLGALLVTRLGRDDCSGLQAVLDGWDGRFSPLVRKRVARHVDGCAACGDVRSRAVSPLALLAALPPIALPDELRPRVLGDVELVSHRGRAWPARRGGFPPPTVDERPRRVLPGAAAAVLLLVLGSAAWSNEPASPAVSVVDTVPPGSSLPGSSSTTTASGAGPFTPAPSQGEPGGPSVPTVGAPAAGGAGNSPRITSPPRGGDQADPAGPDPGPDGPTSPPEDPDPDPRDGGSKGDPAPLRPTDPDPGRSEPTATTRATRPTTTTSRPPPTSNLPLTSPTASTTPPPR